MIVGLKETGWQIIYHRAHALLAAQLAGQWRKKDSPARLYETIAAISHHDDLERELEGDHLTEAGTPEDYTLVDKTSVQQMDELVTSALLGLMIESYLVAGRQELGNGQSVTDACIGWEQTEPLLEQLASAVKQRMQRPI